MNLRCGFREQDMRHFDRPWHLPHLCYTRTMPAPQTEVLITVAGSERGRYLFGPGQYILGRDAGCHIPIEADLVAGRHARLTLNFDNAFIEDIGSDSGTHVNDKPVTGATQLWPNQKIQIGAATVTLRRLQGEVPTDMSLAPAQQAIRRMLPVEMLREKKYDIGGVVAKGGMGAILDAREAAIERKVAMKVMLDTNDAEAVSRFIAEAKVTGQLEHPNVVPVHELGVDENGQPFYTMKMVRGVTLKEVLKQMAAGNRSQESEVRSQAADAHSSLTPSYSLAALLTIFQKVCDALAFAHSKGVIHRDLKPENIMLGDYGEVLVMDWGLAKVIGNKEESGGKESDILQSSIHLTGGEAGPASFAATMAGAVMGTPQYMAPEQAEGRIEDMDARSDIFSLGGILYTILTLRPPVEGRTLDEVLKKVASGSITPPSAFGASTGEGQPGAKGDVLEARKIKPLPHCPGGRVPGALSAVVMKALSLRREDRYQTVAAFSADIAAYQNGFATGAEHASFMKQILLLVRRNKGIFVTGFAAWLIITALAAWFIIHLRASERETRRQAEIAAENEKKATRNAEIAQTNEKRAEANAQEAIAEKENVRHALAKSALALAEAAYREADGPAMQSALDQVPADLRDANWSYLLDQSDTSIARISTGGDMIRGVAAHPKQPGVFAVADSKHKVTIIEARTGVRLLQFDIDLGEASSGTTFHLAFSPDGERIAVGQPGRISDDQAGGIAIHSTRDGTKLLAWNSSGVAKLEFSPDGRHLLQLSAKTHLNLWDATGGKLLWSYKPSTAKVFRGGIMPDGQHVLSSTGSGGFVLLKIEDGTESRALGENANSVDAFAIRPDGLAALWGNGSGDLYCVDLRDGRLIFSNRAHASRVRHVAFTPDGERFVSVANLPDGRQSILLSNAKTGVPLQSLVGGSGWALNIAVHPLSGELLISGQNSRVWDTAGTAAKWVLRSPVGGSAMSSAVFLGSDDLFLGPAKNFLTALIDLRDASTLWRPANYAYHMPTVSTDGRFIAFGKAAPPKGIRIQIARQEAGKVSAVGEFEVAGSAVGLRLSPMGDRLAVISNRKERVLVLAADMGAQVGVMDSESLQGVNGLHWIGGGTQLIGLATANKPRGVAKSEEQIVVWDAATGQRLRSAVHPTALDCMTVAPDGKSFAAAGADKLVHVFDTETLAERQTFRAHDGPITALAWHPARPILATGSEDLTIKLWNLETGRRLDTLRGPTGTPRVLNFSPSGQRLACASEDRMVRIWEPKPLNNAVLDAPAADGWEDLLAKLKADEVKANGNGWTLSGGVLVSGEKSRSVVPLSGSYARSSYVVRTTVRRLRKNYFAVILPVGDQQVTFVLDGDAPSGFATGLSMVDHKSVLETPNAVHGQQIHDSDPHDLEITVRTSARTAQVTATLDDRPLYEWSGAVTSLQISGNWPTLPQPTLHLGAMSADWVVSAVKVKRL